MATDDTCCTIAPYFNVHDGKLDAFRALCERFVDTTRTEEKCLYYGFSFAGNEVHCREAYTDAKGLLAHVKHVGPLLEESLTLADLSRLIDSDFNPYHPLNLANSPPFSAPGPGRFVVPTKVSD